MEHFIFEFTQDWSQIDLDKEDGGMALIYSLTPEDIPDIFVRLQSWDEEKKHSIFNECFLGRKIKVTIETVD